MFGENILKSQILREIELIQLEGRAIPLLISQKLTIHTYQQQSVFTYRLKTIIFAVFLA